MKTIATAYPNRKYYFFSSIKDVVIEARLTENNRIVFYTVESINTKRIPEKTVQEFFPTDTTIKRRPFNYKDNPSFWIVLNRNKKKYKKKFEKLLH